MKAIYTIDIDGLLGIVNDQIAELPFPLPTILIARDVLKQLLNISIGYEDRRDLIKTRLGESLYQLQLIPYQIDDFISTTLNAVERNLLDGCNLRLHYSNHTYELGGSLVVYETDTVKQRSVYVPPIEMTDYHRRVMQEQALDQEREEAYANERFGNYQRSHWTG